MTALLSVALILLFGVGTVALLMGDRAPLSVALAVTMMVFFLWSTWGGDGDCRVLCQAVTAVVSSVSDPAVLAQTPLPPPPQDTIEILADLLRVPPQVVQSTLNYP